MASRMRLSTPYFHRLMCICLQEQTCQSGHKRSGIAAQKREQVWSGKGGAGEDRGKIRGGRRGRHLNPLKQ